MPPWRAGTTTLFDISASMTTQTGEIDYLESIPGLLKRLKNPAQNSGGRQAPEAEFMNGQFR